MPGLRGEVSRFSRLRYIGRDASGAALDRSVDGFHARVVQHECDHLDGVLYPQRVEDMTRFRLYRRAIPGAGRVAPLPLKIASANSVSELYPGRLFRQASARDYENILGARAQRIDAGGLDRNAAAGGTAAMRASRPVRSAATISSTNRWACSSGVISMTGVIGKWRCCRVGLPSGGVCSVASLCSVSSSACSSSCVMSR